MSPFYQKLDPVHLNADGKWYFWDETWSFEEGPHETEAEAKVALERYCNEQLGCEFKEK